MRALVKKEMKLKTEVKENPNKGRNSTVENKEYKFADRGVSLVVTAGLPNGL